jgi:sterol desaturase/sphingolipid hydroxylase (fatty acid hydroxylase superfamily)
MLQDDPVLQDLFSRIAAGLSRLALGGAGLLAPVFLVSSLVIAFVLWRMRRPGVGFLRWALPREIWFHPSHRVDLKVLIFSRILMAASSLLAIASATTIGTRVSELVGATFGKIAGEPAVSHPFLVATLVFLTADFCQYWSHRLTHDWAFLWPFHATHHSAEVMTPITVLRRHPVDNMFCDFFTGIVTGLLLGVILGVTVGPVPLGMLAGLSVSFYLFCLLGGNLRHSHIWLSYGRFVEHLLISPAQHQIHHSCDPRHHNRNYGLILAIWDWMFGTLYIPRGREELTFGLADAAGEKVAQPHGTLVRFMVEPFRASIRALRRKRPAPRLAIRGGDELSVVPGRQLEAAVLPVARAPGLFRGLDPFARGGHEVPPDEARSVHGGPAE